MYMFLTLLLVGFAVCLVTAVMVAGLSPRPEAQTAAQPELKPELTLQAPPQFFAQEAPPLAPRGQVPVEVLLSQLQRHVQLEQAAAETFLSLPTTEALHQRTSSPFVN